MSDIYTVLCVILNSLNGVLEDTVEPNHLKYLVEEGLVSVEDGCVRITDLGREEMIEFCITQEIADAFGCWDLTEDKVICGVKFEEGTYLEDVILHFGYKEETHGYIIDTDGSVQGDSSVDWEERNLPSVYRMPDGEYFMLFGAFWCCTPEAPFKPCDYDEFYDHCKDLDDLYFVMKHDNQNLMDWSELPTFGGEELEDTTEVWSWDEKRMIVGSCGYELEIVDRGVCNVPTTKGA